MKGIDPSHPIFLSYDPQRVEAVVQPMVAAFSSAELSAWAEEHIVTREIGGQHFRMIVDQGEDPTKAIVVGGEYGNGVGALGAIARAQVIRKVVAPSASLILQPNTSLGESNMNFSKDERKTLRQGSAAPLTDRIRMTLEQSGEPERIVAYGPSQGGIAALALGAHSSMPRMATAVLETPNVAHRSYIGVAKDFLGSGADLKANILSNFTAGGELGNELVASLSAKGLAKYAAGLALVDNRALLGVIRRASAKEQMLAIVKRGGSVVHAWAEGDAVSPAAANTEILQMGRNLPIRRRFSYEGYSFKGDHSITNQYLLAAVLARRAYRMMGFDI